jgi:thiamine biosynthesis protein ThiI
MDKDEIVASAERLGTFPISIIPDQDCCQLFTPRHPATRASRDDVEEVEALLPVAGMVDAAVATTVTEDFRFPAAESRAAHLK